MTSADTPTFLEALKYAREYEMGKVSALDKEIKIAIISNFTDDVLKKAMTGLCVSSSIEPRVYAVPFKQYFFELKNTSSGLFNHEPDVIYIFFDINAYRESEFTKDKTHTTEVISDIENLCQSVKSTIVIQTCITPSSVQHNRLFVKDAVSETVAEFNSLLLALKERYSNIHIIETDKLIIGSSQIPVYDLRNLYVSSQPFTNDFLYRVSLEWFAYIKSIIGITKKCLVVDLDNTLWGGVVGEVGPLGIALGPDYPGNAFVAFQKVLLEYYHRGIILAINSRNNPADVLEVFEKNPHMVLKESHFACIVTNWETKADNLIHIAKELNIGLDSMVFIDDDAMNRDLVKTQLPEVSVPDFSLQPETYAHTLLNLPDFHSLTLTEEDMRRGEMYASERKRKEIQTKAPTLKEYLTTLNIQVRITINNRDVIPRLSQMTQKTNQFNLTTLRATESEISDWIENEALVYAGEVSDNFGSYGLTLMSSFHPKSETELSLEVCLMSCRVMGREVEHAFFESIAHDLVSRGYTTVHATYTPTTKNIPSQSYLSALGGTKIDEENGSEIYHLDLLKIVAEKREQERPIQVTLITP